MTAQRALAALGYDVGAPDGIVGMKTRAALRAWQKDQGLVADGYLSLALVQRLAAQAQAPTAQPSTNEVPLASGPSQVITASSTATTPQTTARAKP
jgi:peptidoglycan hydrolase-like protein with peptidoglycan-binding domain